MSDRIAITSGDLTSVIAPLGAELLSLTDAQGREYMTDADPRWWTGHAPILFPIVGALNGGVYSLDGREYAMGKHGFARKSVFTVAECAPDRVRFVLEDSVETRRQFPFGFALAIDHALANRTHTIAATVTNRDDKPLPFSIGFHPAFAWPLPGGAAKEAHRIMFARPEPEPIRRIDPLTGLLLHDSQPTPVVDDTLVPTPEMFEPDALIWEAPASHACTFGAPGGASVALAWDNLPMLGVWQKPGAHYLCIEPWHGIADPAGFEGDFRDKPGIVEIVPGTSASFRLSITVTPPSEHHK